MSKLSGFNEFVADHGQGLARIAYLLCGDTGEARGLAVRTLVKVAAEWPELRWRGPAEPARRHLFREFLGGPAKSYPTGSGLRDALGALTPRRRVAVVARFHAALPEFQTALLLGCDFGTLAMETTAALTELRHRLPELKAPAVPRPEPEAVGGEDPSPWTSPTPQPAHPAAPRTGDDPLYHALTTLAAELPKTDLVPEASRTVQRHRVRRRMMIITAVLVTTTAIVIPVAWTADAVVKRVEHALAEDRQDPYATDERPQAVPEAIPVNLGEPVRYAYHGYCLPPGEADENAPCNQWRVVTMSGKEWRVPYAAHGLRPDDEDYWPFIVSHDGRRIAYLSTGRAQFVVYDLRSGENHVIDTREDPTSKGYGAALTVSANGRWFAVSFANQQGAAEAAVLDTRTGITRSLHESCCVLGVRDDGWVVATQTRDVTRVPGHTSVTKVVMWPPGKNRTPGRWIDSRLTEAGVALSRDGRSIALLTTPASRAKGHPGLIAKMDLRTGRILRTVKPDLAEGQVMERVEGWLDSGRVLVRTSEQHDEYDDEDYEERLYMVDLPSGAAGMLDLTGKGNFQVPYGVALGKLN